MLELSKRSVVSGIAAALHLSNLPMRGAMESLRPKLCWHSCCCFLTFNISIVAYQKPKSRDIEKWKSHGRVWFCDSSVIHVLRKSSCDTFFQAAAVAGWRRVDVCVKRFRSACVGDVSTNHGEKRMQPSLEWAYNNIHQQKWCRGGYAAWPNGGVQCLRTLIHLGCAVPERCCCWVL